jgi:mono/diheme cytochrome c family protein
MVKNSKVSRFLALPLSVITTLFLFSHSIDSQAVDDFTEGEKLFALKALPIMADKCFSCHGDDPEEIEGELDLTYREGMLKGGESFDDVVIPGDSEFSFIMEAIRWEDPDYEMPPKENDRLTEAQTWAIRDWIDAGAPWPDENRVALIRDKYAEGVIVQTSGALSEEWATRRYKEEDLWAYQPIQDPAIPETKSGSDHPIDAFIDYKLEQIGIPDMVSNGAVTGWMWPGMRTLPGFPMTTSAQTPGATATT